MAFDPDRRVFLLIAPLQIQRTRSLPLHGSSLVLEAPDKQWGEVGEREPEMDLDGYMMAACTETLHNRSG